MSRKPAYLDSGRIARPKGKDDLILFESGSLYMVKDGNPIPQGDKILLPKTLWDSWDDDSGFFAQYDYVGTGSVYRDNGNLCLEIA